MPKTIKLHRIRIVLAAAVVLGLLALPVSHPAEAAFPGKNGVIAFVSNRDANAEVYTLNPANGSAAVRITFPSGGSTDPAFSPDGSKVAFNRGGDIYVMDAGGMNPNGTGAQRITTSASFEGEPSWSPDGQKIAFVASAFEVDGSTDLEIWTMKADGTGRAPITNNTFPDTQPAWSPLGDKVAFVSTRTGDIDRNVYIMNSDGTGQASITPTSPAGCAPNCYQGHDDDPTWSPDGTKIAYVHGYGPPDNPLAGGGVPNIWTMDPSGANKTNVSNTPDTSSVSPTWSPDGTKIAYVGAVDTDRNIYAMNADGSGQSILHSNVANDIKPDWQQDSLPPETTIASGPPSLTNSTSASFTFASRDTHSTFRCSLDGAAFAPCSSPESYTVAAGPHTFRVAATDVAGNQDATPAARTWTVDTVRPTVTGVTPAGGAKNVAPTSNVTSTFSEPMNAATVNRTTFRLVRRGTTTPVAATVVYSAATKRAILNPGRNLALGATYTATVTTGTKDVAGNSLSAARTWSFTVRR